MNIGIPKERRPFEFRVGMVPTGVQILAQQGHTIYIEHGAGLGSGFTDQEYEKAGGKIVYSAHEVFGRADILLKFARPLHEELEWLRPGTAVAGMLHLASSRQDKIDLLITNKITAIAFEQIELPDGTRPILRPLSTIGGRLAAQIAARLLQNNEGGKGILLGGIASVPPAEVVVIGAGVVGINAARSFIGMGAHVTVLDVNMNALEFIYETFPGVVTQISNPITVAHACSIADVVVVAVLVPGVRAPIVVTRDMLRNMKERSIIMDISIDQGGAVETSRPTTHQLPTFLEEGIVHYCVPNIPSVVARTATYAYLNAAAPYVLEIVNKGVERAIMDNPAIESGVNTFHGEPRHLARIAPEDD